MRSRKRVKRNSKSWPRSSRSSSFAGRMTCSPNIVSTLTAVHHSTLTNVTIAVPVKYEHVVFCRMSDIQREMYCHFVDHPRTKAELRGKEAKPLVAINILKKLVNHPELLPIGKEATRDDFDNKKDAEKEMHMCQVFKDTLPAGWGDRRHVHSEWSGKFLVLERFLDKMRAETNDKIVLISNYTSTMDVFEKMLRAKRYASRSRFQPKDLTSSA